VAFSTSWECSFRALAVRFQSALRMRGLFNPTLLAAWQEQGGVSIRLADAWPFQRRGSGLPQRGRSPCFNPPCGCVAFSTARMSIRHAVFDCVSIRLADAWPFQLGGRILWCAPHRRVSIRLADAWPFQPDPQERQTGGVGVSIRLADAWPFQLCAIAIAKKGGAKCFNPPCGCVAFSTGRGARAGVGMGLRFNPPCGCVAFSTRRRRASSRPRRPFQSALRMRGLFNMAPPASSAACRCFNPPCGCVAFSTSARRISATGCAAFQSALRMRGLFNRCVNAHQR